MEKSGEKSLYEKKTSFDYLGSAAADRESRSVGVGGHGDGGGVDYLAAHPLRPHQQAAGPFHYLISEQAKSLVALQELQHEVGALLEFRDLVMETFPNLRSKLAQQSTDSSPITGTGHHHQSNLPISVRSGEWTPGIRFRKKLVTSSGNKDKKSNDSNCSVAAIQDSGFSTEASSKETHSASSTAPLPSTSGHEFHHEAASSDELDDVEDELWSLLDIIHRKGTRLKEEAEALQGSIREHVTVSDCDEVNFKRVLFHSSSDDVSHLRQERDVLLERLAELEAEVLTGQIHTSRLQEELEHLISAKQDLEDQLKAIASHRGEVNSRIHDLHTQFVTKSSSDEKLKLVVSANSHEKCSAAKDLFNKECLSHKDCSSQCQNSYCVNNSGGFKCGSLDSVLGDRLPKVTKVESEKIAAILKEQSTLVLKKHLLVSTVQNQALRQRLESIASKHSSLREQLTQARDDNEDLRFQLEDKTIELEGTKARVRLLEDLHKPNIVNNARSPDIIPNLDISQSFNRPPSRTEISTPSMKAMSPFPMNNPDHTSSTESAHDMTAADSTKSREHSGGSTKRRPSKIPLKSYTAPRSSGKQSPSAPRSRSGDSPHRSHSAQSGRTNNRSSDGSTLSLPKSRNTSLISARDSLSCKLRSSETVTNSNSKSPLSTPVNQKKKNNGNSSTAAGRWTSPSNLSASSHQQHHKDEKDTPSWPLEKYPSPWTRSSSNGNSIHTPEYLDSTPEYLDSLVNKTPSPSFNQMNTDSENPNFHTANTFVWHTRNEFFDSIDSNVGYSSCFRSNGEDLAECDSLEKHILSDSSFGKRELIKSLQYDKT